MHTYKIYIWIYIKKINTFQFHWHRSWPSCGWSVETKILKKQNYEFIFSLTVHLCNNNMHHQVKCTLQCQKALKWFIAAHCWFLPCMLNRPCKRVETRKIKKENYTWSVKIRKTDKKENSASILKTKTAPSLFSLSCLWGKLNVFRFCVSGSCWHFAATNRFALQQENYNEVQGRSENEQIIYFLVMRED